MAYNGEPVTEFCDIYLAMQENSDGNTAGSLSQIQHAVLLGSILGDGCLRRQKGKLNALLEINHSVKYKEYVDWKYKIFQSYILSPPKQRNGNGKRVAYRFTTRSLPVFTEYFLKFYSTGYKKIPVDIEIDELALAVWFMDDGNKSRSSFYLNTQQLDLEDQLKLIELLQKKFNIKSSLNRDKQYFRIRIATESASKFRSMISPHILEIFKYKICEDPVTTDSKEEALRKQGKTPTLDIQN